MTADPVFGGAVAIGIGAALVALGSTLGGIVNAQGSGNSAIPSAYYGPASTITTLYGGPGGNPVSGLPGPTGPQQPIVVTGNNILGTNDLGLARAIVDLANHAGQ